MQSICSFLNRTALCLCLTMLLCAVTFAQFDTATVFGSVRDVNGAVVPNANVRLRNTATGIEATTTSDNDGNYQFFNVKISPYQVTAEAQGFAKGRAENVQVTVTADGVQLETESSARGQVIGKEQIVNLPLNGRNYTDLALLSPGVRKSLLNRTMQPIWQPGRRCNNVVHPRISRIFRFCSMAALPVIMRCKRSWNGASAKGCTS